MQREGRDKSYHFSNLFFFFTLSYNSAWVKMTDTNPKNQDYQWKCQLTPQNSAVSGTTLLLQWIQRGFAPKSSITLSLFQSHIIYLEAIVSPDSQPSTSVWYETLRCCILSAPGYQSSRCWCWGEMRMLSTSLSQDKWTWWRWWLRAVINALWGSDVAAHGCPHVVFVAHFFTENRCWFCHLLMFPRRNFHTILTW